MLDPSLICGVQCDLQFSRHKHFLEQLRYFRLIAVFLGNIRRLQNFKKAVQMRVVLNTLIRNENSRKYGTKTAHMITWLSFSRQCFPYPGLKSLPYAFFRFVSEYLLLHETNCWLIRIMASIPSGVVMEWCQSEWSLAQCCISNHYLLMELQYASHLHCYQVTRPSCTSISFNSSPY